MSVEVVTDPDELSRLHALGETHIDARIACSGRDSWKHPEHDLLQYFGDAEKHDVAVLYGPEPHGYIVVEKASGQILWLVMLGKQHATGDTVQALCGWCLNTHGICWGNVTNDAVRALFDRPEAEVSGSRVRWIG